MKLRITATREYEVNPEHYPDCNTPEEMAAIDLEGGIEILMYGLEDNSTSMKIEVVKE